MHTYIQLYVHVFIYLYICTLNSIHVYNYMDKKMLICKLFSSFREKDLIPVLPLDFIGT